MVVVAQEHRQKHKKFLNIGVVGKGGWLWGW